MPVQQLAVEAGLLYGKDLLVVSATASGKTFIGEMAGLKNLLEKRGRVLFLVPLVALRIKNTSVFHRNMGILLMSRSSPVQAGSRFLTTDDQQTETEMPESLWQPMKGLITS
jgi:helicase